MDYKKQIETLERTFDALNDRFYKGRLTRPVITYGYDSTYSTFGWCSLKKVWNNENYEINITSNTIKHNKHGYAETMLHEMAHLYAILHDIEDTSNNGYYHNKQYKKIAENHGLICNQTKYGWNGTSLNAEAEEFCNGLDKLDMYRWSPMDEKEDTDGDDDDATPTADGDKPVAVRKYRRWIELRCPACDNRVKVVDISKAVRCELCNEIYTSVL